MATGLDEIKEALGVPRRGQITLDTKLVVRVGDLAYLSNGWALREDDAGREPRQLGATTAEVARRQPDGTWLYVIDNAWGDAAANATCGPRRGPQSASKAKMAGKRTSAHTARRPRPPTHTPTVSVATKPCSTSPVMVASCWVTPSLNTMSLSSDVCARLRTLCS